MNLKKMFTLLMSALLILVLATGCGRKSSENTVEMVAKGFQHDFWKAVKQGAEQAGKDYGVNINFVGPEGEGAIAAQVEMLNNAINKKPAAICIAALDTTASLDAINKAKANNIPVIGFDSGVPGAPEGTIVANASTDNYKAGELAAEKMYDSIKAKLSGQTVRIGVVSQEANSQSISMRTQGFLDKMVNLIESTEGFGKGSVAVIGHTKFANGISSGKVIIDVAIPAEINDTQGQTSAQTLLNKNDLIAIYGSNEFAAKAIINADAAISGGRIGPDKVIAVGFDSGALQIDAIRNQKFLGSVTQDPVSIGYRAVELAVQAMKGETNLEDIDTGSKWYDHTNIDSEQIKPLLYQ
ncbi:MAG: ABC transporter substrate-binding protein [Clostridia bacterium]|nr:ABC transporter substrate-binding protein [Clostridia bacterium]